MRYDVRVTIFLVVVLVASPGVQGRRQKRQEPGCILNEDCTTDKVCAKRQCVDPCPGVCGAHTVCRVTNHVATCSCSQGSGTRPPVPHGKKRYYVESSSEQSLRPWLNATMSCLRNNSRLVAVESMEELWDIRREINNTGDGCYYYWTSGTDVGQDGDYIWASTGTRIPTKSDMWVPGDLSTVDEHCVLLGKLFTDIPDRPEHELYNYSCDNLACYICEYYS